MSEPSSINVFVVDDHQMFVSGIRSIFEGDDRISIVGHCTDGNKVLDELAQLPVDVVLLDINLPGKDGVELNRLIHEQMPSVKIIALTMHQEASFIQNMIQGGAKGYVLKNSGKEQLQSAILAVAAGGTWFGQDVKDALMQGMMPEQARLEKKRLSPIPKLSRREKEVLKLITQEFTTAEIAEQLFISLSTVETHRKNLLQKLNVRNTAGLVRFAMENGLVD